MSLIRAIKHRLGLSVTPANNFVLDASADNGTMKLARESGQDIMTVDAAGKVAFPQNAQTWQDLTASRTHSTDYTNNTAQPIQVIVTAASPASGGMVSLLVGGVTIASMQNNMTTGTNILIPMTITVPVGAIYRLTLGPGTTIYKWSELR